MHDPHDITPLSPLSQSSSGYFSSSVSTVTLSDVLQPSSSSSSLLAAEAALPANPQQQSTDRNDVMTSPSQCGAKTATATATAPPPATSHSSANHNNVTAENSFSKQKLLNSGGGGSEGFERLEIFVDDEERSHDDELPEWLTEGVYVTVGSNKAGTVRYVGTTQFAEGVWVGVELDTPVGRLARVCVCVCVCLHHKHSNINEYITNITNFNGWFNQITKTFSHNTLSEI